MVPCSVCLALALAKKFYSPFNYPPFIFGVSAFDGNDLKSILLLVFVKTSRWLVERSLKKRAFIEDRASLGAYMGEHCSATAIVFKRLVRSKVALAGSLI